MTETQELLTHTVSFSRKVQVRQYESAEATIFIQYSTNRDAEPSEIVAGAVQAFSEAKSLVYDQLGLEKDFVEGVVVEIIEGQFGPGVERVKPEATKVTDTAAYKAAGGPAVPDVAGGDVSGKLVPANPPFKGTTRVPEEKKANREWAEARYATHPQEFTDNRAKKASGEINSKSPDFKHTDSGAAFWLPDAA